jgi:hypothetical protein
MDGMGGFIGIGAEAPITGRRQKLRFPAEYEVGNNRYYY